MIKFTVEKLDTVYEEIQDLLKQHWEEIAVLKDTVKLNPSYDAYRKLEDSGKLYILTVREDGRLVGYYVSIVTKNPHYMDEVWAINDIMYLHPDYRKALTGYTMIRKAEEDLKKMGATVSTVHVKVAHPCDSLMNRLGYLPNEINYIRKL